MADISKIKTPNGTTYDIKDTVARAGTLPAVSSSDNGKIPRVVNGAWTITSVVAANVYDGLDSTSPSDALSANQGKVLNSNLAQYKKIFIETTNVTTSSNGNFRIGDFTNQTHIILSIIVNSPSNLMAIPTKYSEANPGYLGGHAMSVWSNHAVAASKDLNITYAYTTL